MVGMSGKIVQFHVTSFVNRMSNDLYEIYVSQGVTLCSTPAEKSPGIFRQVEKNIFTRRKRPSDVPISTTHVMKKYVASK